MRSDHLKRHKLSCKVVPSDDGIACGNLSRGVNKGQAKNQSSIGQAESGPSTNQTDTSARATRTKAGERATRMSIDGEETTSSDTETETATAALELKVQSAMQDIKAKPEFATNKHIEFAYGHVVSDEVSERLSRQQLTRQFASSSLRLAQRQMLNIISSFCLPEVSERNILAFVDVEGNLGKTYLCEWIKTNIKFEGKRIVIMPDTRYNSVSSIRHEIKESKIQGEQLLLFLNLKRAYMYKDLLNIELIADGFWATGYQSNTIKTVKPKICIMCNSIAEAAKLLSKDRLKAWHYDTKRLRFNPPEYAYIRQNENLTHLSYKGQVSAHHLNMSEKMPQSILDIINQLPRQDDKTFKQNVDAREKSEWLLPTTRHVPKQYKLQMETVEKVNTKEKIEDKYLTWDEHFMMTKIGTNKNLVRGPHTDDAERNEYNAKFKAHGPKLSHYLKDNNIIASRLGKTGATVNSVIMIPYTKM